MRATNPGSIYEPHYRSLRRTIEFAAALARSVVALTV